MKIHALPGFPNPFRIRVVLAEKSCRPSHLSAQPFAAGAAFSMTDITVLGGLMFAGFAQIPVPEDCSALTSWAARLQERPSVKHPA